MQAPRGMTRSDALARRALAFALDPTVSNDEAATRLVDLAGAHARTLELALARIRATCSTGAVADTAVGALRLALLRTKEDRAVRLVVIGRPGAGKGTQCADLARHLGIPHLSTGDLLRNVSMHETPFASEVQAYMDPGQLVPHHLVLRLLEARLAQPDATERGFLLDGFPRTVAQAETLETVLAPRGIDAVIELVVRAETAIARLRLRARRDDTDEAVTRRLEQYHHDTAPVLTWYEARTAILRVDGERPAHQVAAELLQRVDAIRFGPSKPGVPVPAPRHHHTWAP